VIRVLCFDIEGGHGGSSRSLFQSIRHLDRNVIEPEVIVRRGGAIERSYAELGIPVRVIPELPQASSLQNWRANLRLYAGTGYELLKAKPHFKALATEIDSRFDAVHFNHEGFWQVAGILRRRTHRPFTMHVRTMGYPTLMARFEAQRIGRTIDTLVFITENERDRFRAAGVQTPGTVIHNIAEPESEIARHAAMSDDGRFTIACLSNYTWERGVDRLISIAEIFAQRGRKDVRFVVAGDMTLPKYLDGELGELGRRDGTLADYAKARGVADYFNFLGHVPDPERVLASSDLLIKPTREANPWGRDVIEALTAAKPVATLGTYSKFAEDGKTGILMAEFQAEAMADRLEHLADNRGECAALGEAGRARVAVLCNGPARSRDLAAVWMSAVENSIGS
jgi:glycosyltransferase involved in cell wall biosynthesis